MSKKPSPFRHFNDLNKKNYNYSDDYQASLMNLCYSSFMDTVELGSVMEFQKTTGKRHYDTMFHATPKTYRERRSIPKIKQKEDVEEETLIKALSLYYRFDTTEARKTLKYLDKEDISVIMKYYNTQVQI